MTTPAEVHLHSDVADLRRRVDELEDTLQAIRRGEVDAVLVGAGSGTVHTLEQADRPYRLLVEQMPQAAATLTPEGKILFANRYFADLVALPADDLPGGWCQGLIPPAGQELFEALLLAARVEGSSQGDVTLRRHDGALVPIYLGVNALREGATGLCLIVTDLTERRRHEALVAAEALARSILDQAVDAIVVCDAAGRVVRASREAHALSGAPPLGDPFGSAFPLRRCVPPGDEGGDAVISLDAVLAGQTIRGVEACLGGAGGRRTELLVSAGPLRDVDGRAVGAVVTLTDISERRQAEEALRRAHDELERRVEERTAELKAAQAQALRAERLAAVGQMAAGLAHEGRNALQRSQACLSMLELRLHDRPEERELLARIQRAQDDLHRLYEEVREYAAPLRLEKRGCRLDDLWREAWEDLAERRQGHALTLDADCGGRDWECLADPFRLKQVFRNLLENALEAGGGRVEITCSAGRVGQAEAIRVAVRDDGPGLPAELRPRLFEPFQTTKLRGTGLGLAICRRIMEAHGGWIAAGEGGAPGAEIILMLPRSSA